MNLVENLQKDILPFLADEAATASLLKRVLLFFEDGEFAQADNYCEKVLDADPENPVAYLYKLMASRRISSLADLASAQNIVDNEATFKKAVRFAPEEMQLHLQQLNMQIYACSIEACLERAKIHLTRSELKETAQQYQDAMKLWEVSHDALPNAKEIYAKLAGEVSSFNWKLLLHNRQCPDDSQLIARSIPINNERLYLNAVKWADEEKKAYFESVARDTLFNAHLKCIDYIKSKQTRLAQIWANHYQAAAAADDCLTNIHQALVDTDGFTKFSADAPAGMLQLIKHYQTVYPNAVDETKAILQDYYVRIFRSLLDFTGKEPQVISATSRIDEESYAVMIAQQEAHACNPGAKITPVQKDVPTTAPATDPVWATKTAQRITAQMADSVSDNLSPYGIASTYLVAAKELTIRYNSKDGIVTEPLLFRFICQYYANAIAQVQPEQASVIQAKFNDFLIETVRLPSATAEIVTEASHHMQGNPLPYQIYLARITNNYSAKSEDLIPPEVVAGVDKWHQSLTLANPKKNCYWLSGQQKTILASFTAAETAINRCRQYTEMLRASLESPYQQVLTSSGDNCEALSSGWEQRMETLQSQCNEWANALEVKLNQARELNSTKLSIALKCIKAKAAWQLFLSMGMHLLFVLTVLAFTQTIATNLSAAWNLVSIGDELPEQISFYAINILAPLIAGMFSVVNGVAAPTYGEKRNARKLWLFFIFSIFTYVLIYLDINTVLFNPEAIGFVDNTNLFAAAILAFIAIIRTLLEFFLCKLGNHTRSKAVKASCRIGSIYAKVVGLVQALACFAIAILYIRCLMLTL